jgi:hypothetical protein
LVETALLVCYRCEDKPAYVSNSVARCVDATYFVLMMSSGVRSIAAMAEAATATARDVRGYGESMTSIVDPKLAISPGSGTLTNAASKLVDQLSIVFSRTL